MARPKVLEDVEKGSDVIVHPELSQAPSLRGEVVRLTDTFAWIKAVGLRDIFRVSRTSGRGAHHQVSYRVEPAGEEALEAVDHAAAVDALRTTVYVLNEQCRVRGAGEVFREASATEVRDIDERLRTYMT